MGWIQYWDIWTGTQGMWVGWIMIFKAMLLPHATFLAETSSATQCSKRETTLAGLQLKGSASKKASVVIIHGAVLIRVVFSQLFVAFLYIVWIYWWAIHDGHGCVMLCSKIALRLLVRGLSWVLVGQDQPKAQKKAKASSKAAGYPLSPGKNAQDLPQMAWENSIFHGFLPVFIHSKR